ncbi:MAG: DNA modification methylase [Akkermansiaceae bacterium]|nr:DNA modification methylase [Akkermansiaceae bacterium]
MQEDPRFLSEQLITYIGNKRALLPLIGRGIEAVLQRTGRDKLRIFDAFAGSGVVSRYLKQYSSVLYSNDLEAYSRILNTCYLSNHGSVNTEQLQHLHARLLQEAEAHPTAGLLAELYAPADDQNIRPGERVFYTRRNAVFLDTLRRAIDHLPQNRQAYFLAPLLTQASVHTNTSGVFKGFHKNAQGIGQFGGRGKNALQRILAPITLPLPLFSRFECEYHVLQQDATVAARSLPPLDLAYLDPPYNQHPYGSNYFMLNLLVNYQRPQLVSRVSGIPTNWNRSPYNTKAHAAASLQELIEATPASFILLSYNSEGFISPQEMDALLSRLGKVTLMQQDYATFRGCRNLRNRAVRVKEMLYLLER